jgi:hypothetical protein
MIQMRAMDLRRLTIDVDGTVISTGNKVAWAMHGYNPLNIGARRRRDGHS